MLLNPIENGFHRIVTIEAGVHVERRNPRKLREKNGAHPNAGAGGNAAACSKMKAPFYAEGFPGRGDRTLAPTLQRIARGGIRANDAVGIGVGIVGIVHDGVQGSFLIDHPLGFGRVDHRCAALMEDARRYYSAVLGHSRDILLFGSSGTSRTCLLWDARKMVYQRWVVVVPAPRDEE